MHSDQLLWQYNLLLLLLRLMKFIDLDDEVHFVDIPNKSKKVTSLVFNKGLINNN